MKKNNSKLLGKMSVAAFLKKYWNKKPLVIRGALKHVDRLANEEDFFSMAQDDEFETRMVYARGGDYPWQAKLGPFKKSAFNKKKLWTLICHNLELLNSDFFDLKEMVRFVPDWHFDDIMATISNKGASVGAHIDDYSVFIIQAKGRRKWLLQEKAKADYIEGLDIRLLKEFRPETEIILEPGDLLYLPPKLAHHGISLEDSISYSIGFKSIRYKELLYHYLNDVETELENASYLDLHYQEQKDPFHLPDYVVDQIRGDLLKLLGDKETFRSSLLSYLSRSKYVIENEGRISMEEFMRLLNKKKNLKRNIWARLSSGELNADEVQVSINSCPYKVSKALYLQLKELFEKEADDLIKFKASELKDSEFIKIMFSLVNGGIFYFD